MLAAALAVVAIVVPNSKGVPDSLWNHLGNGVNICRWFCYTKPNPDHYAHYLTGDDFRAFKSLGLNFVRLCISPDLIDSGDVPNSGTLPYIDKAIARLEDSGLDVIWDLHDNGQLKLDAGADNSSFLRFWQAIASHYKGQRETSLIFEILNEPIFEKNSEVWYQLQEQTVKAVREVDPDRTIMVAPTVWSGVDQIVKMSPLPEGNLIYTFHCYDPFFFTHQGAEWIGNWPGKLRNVPFPSSPVAVAPILQENGVKYRSALEGYGRQRYDDAYLLDRIQTAVGWGKSHRVPVLLGEFGAYPKVAPPDSRARWFEGMKRAIAATGVPAALWGYDDGLGLSRKIEGGRLRLDPIALESFYGIKRYGRN